MSPSIENPSQDVENVRHFVLASLRSSTYGGGLALALPVPVPAVDGTGTATKQKGGSPHRSLRPRWMAFLNILWVM